jgi:hypothetical protein
VDFCFVSPLLVLSAQGAKGNETERAHTQRCFSTPPNTNKSVEERERGVPVIVDCIVCEEREPATCSKEGDKKVDIYLYIYILLSLTQEIFWIAIEGMLLHTCMPCLASSLSLFIANTSSHLVRSFFLSLSPPPRYRAYAPPLEMHII